MAMAGAGRSSPSLRVPRGSEVSLTQPRVTLARDTDMDFSHDDAPISDPLVESQPADSEFGPWMIVSRRRGRVCGRGTGLCAGHVTSDVAATGNTALLGPHARSAVGTHGAHRVEAVALPILLASFTPNTLTLMESLWMSHSLRIPMQSLLSRPYHPILLLRLVVSRVVLEVALLVPMLLMLSSKVFIEIRMLLGLKSILLPLSWLLMVTISYFPMLGPLLLSWLALELQV